MIKCYFVDVKSISSTVPKSKFKKAEIERLADAMLAADGLLRPLILQQTGVEKYTVIEGHREYYAAVSAKEKDIKKAEMVNAFIIDANLHRSAIEQLKLFTPQSVSEAPTSDNDPNLLTDIIAASIDRLLPEITAAISTQLQPIVSQLTNHQQILDTIKLALVNKPIDESEKPSKAKEITQSVSKVAVPKPEVAPEKETKPKIDREKKSKPIETLASDLPEPKPTKATKTTSRSSKKANRADKPSASIAVAIAPQIQTTDPIPATKTTKPVADKPAATGGSMDVVKSAIALDLINNLSKDELLIKVERSGVKITRDIVESIILKRDSQPAQKFDIWDDLSVLKIKGLTATKIQEIIKKLK